MQTLYLNFKVTMTHGSSSFMAFNHSDLQSCPPISTPPSPVRYAKFESIQYFIDIDILQNCLIDIDTDIDIFQNHHIDIDIDIDIFGIAL